MPHLTRRRFLAISAACVASPALAAPVYRWRGTAMGSAASLTLVHPDAAAIAARAAAEIDRLEDIFSLYRAGSALSRLNREATLTAPPFEMLEVLSLAGRVHVATGGLFDPTVQPLWQLHATACAAGGKATPAQIEAALALTGWLRLRYDSTRITLDPGMGLTLNGIAQGYVADRVATLLRAEGLRDILIDTGEIVALGHAPRGGDWPVTLALGGRRSLSDRALATSAPLGTVLDAEGTVGHILDPATGLSAPGRWRSISVSAPTAAVADALSTAACLMDRAAIDRALAACPGARLEHLA
jgi:FAD:protein FMN transferase